MIVITMNAMILLLTFYMYDLKPDYNQSKLFSKRFFDSKLKRSLTVLLCFRHGSV